jgi:uncharacterized repeat protein (TIGR04042 family)
MHFRVRWPDDTVTDCYSPSLVVKEHLEAGRSYPLAEFVERSATALNIGSERVREKYGFACSSAMDQLRRIEELAARFEASPIRWCGSNPFRPERHLLTLHQHDIARGTSCYPIFRRSAPPQRHHHRRRTGRPVHQLVPETGRHRSSGAGKAPGRPCLAQRALGHFCLVTPNWQCNLPGYPYRGDDPYGFMKKDEIVAYLDGFVASFQPPVREGVSVQKLWRTGEGWRITASDGDYSADQVVAVGGYHIPVVPRAAERLPADIVQIHSSQYLNPQSLPEGEVLVVGTGQSGCQIAEDLHLAGRRVHLGVGEAPRVARTYRGKDVVEWLDKMKYYDLPVDQHPLGTGVREKTNHYVTGRDGGRDIDLRKFALEGMQLYGKFDSLDGEVARFGAGLKGYLDEADAVSESIKDSIDKFIAANRSRRRPRPAMCRSGSRPRRKCAPWTCAHGAFGSGVVHRLPYRFQLDRRAHLRRPWLSRS